MQCEHRQCLAGLRLGSRVGIVRSFQSIWNSLSGRCRSDGAATLPDGLRFGSSYFPIAFVGNFNSCWLTIGAGNRHYRCLLTSMQAEDDLRLHAKVPINR
jgi:hypothetical protein